MLNIFLLSYARLEMSILGKSWDGAKNEDMSFAGDHNNAPSSPPSSAESATSEIQQRVMFESV
jgi:hypothetical protein